MNEWDRIARGIIRQARPASAPNYMEGGVNVDREATSTLTDSEGRPLRLWIPGVDPWGVGGYYFGSRKEAK